MAIATNDLYTLELDAWNGLAVETLRFSGAGPGGYTTGGGDTPPSTNYLPRIAEFMLSRSAFEDHRTSGRGPPAAGEVSLWNRDGVLDKYRAYAFDARAAVMRRGQAANAYPGGWTKVLDGTQHAAVWTQDGISDAIRIAVHDAQLYASVPYQTTLYAGTNVAPTGLEGTAADLKGKPKPVAFGQCFNVPAPCVNAQKRIYQLNDGAIAGVQDARDGGVTIGQPTSWTQTVTGGGTFSGQTLSVAYSPDLDLLVMVTGSPGGGLPGETGTSGDRGQSWTLRTNGFSGAVSVVDVDWGGPVGDKRFVIVGGNGQLSSSSNGTSWTLRTTGITDHLYCVRWCDPQQLWIATGANGKLLTSPTGTTWTSRTSSFGTTAITCLAVGPTYIVAGSGAGSLLGKVAWSSNGTSWTQSTSSVSTNFLQDWTRALYANGEYRMVGTAGLMIRSLDGKSWARMPSAFDGTAGGSTYDLHSIAWGAGVWLVGGTTLDIGIAIDDQWDRRAHQVLGGGLLGSCYTGAQFVGAFGGGYVGVTTNGGTYASLADLQDDTLAPAPGNWKVYLAGGYVRLGLTPTKMPTFDFTVGATAADRTAAQGWAFALRRAGLSAGSGYSAADITALDALNAAVCGHWAGPDDAGLLCGDVADLFAQTAGAAWFADGSGVLRIKQLADPAPNLISQPDALATAPWAVAGGSPVATNDVARYAGRSFSRITAANTGPIRQPVTLPANDTYYYRYFVRTNGVAGTVLTGIFDSTTVAFIAEITATIASDGTITAVATLGTLVRIALLPGGDGVYEIVVKGTGVAAHTNFAYAHVGGTATSVLYSGFELLRGDPDATIIEDDMWGEPSPGQSADDNEGVPPYRMVLRWGKNYAPQANGDLLGEVPDADRTRFGLEWRDAKADRAATLTAHPLSQPATVETLYPLEADAQTEATRRIGILGADPEWYDVTVEMTTVTQAIELFQTVEWVYHRYGLAAGRRFLVLGIRPHAHAQPGPLTTITFTLWRPLT
jgi:hypothetical protein